MTWQSQFNFSNVSASEVTTLWHFKNMHIIIIISSSTCAQNPLAQNTSLLGAKSLRYTLVSARTNVRNKNIVWSTSVKPSLLNRCKLLVFWYPIFAMNFSICRNLMPVDKPANANNPTASYLLNHLEWSINDMLHIGLIIHLCDLIGYIVQKEIHTRNNV